MIDLQTLHRVLRDGHTIAVVGLSAESHRPSYVVAQYMQEHGHRIVPVNPKYAEILGEKSYPDLASIPFAVDMVDVFRKPQDCLSIAQQAIAIGAKTLWLQIGVINEEARALAEQAGLTVVMDRCVKIEHARLFGSQSSTGSDNGIGSARRLG
ncbi:MAG: CoA-binding protein [Rhodoferax sp.]